MKKLNEKLEKGILYLFILGTFGGFCELANFSDKLKQVNNNKVQPENFNKEDINIKKTNLDSILNPEDYAIFKDTTYMYLIKDSN